MADLILTIIVAMGAATLGALDALHFLLGFAGCNPAVDVSLCVFAIAVVTTAVLGAMLLAHHICVRGRVARRNAAARLVEEVFPRMVQMVAFPVAFVIAACLLISHRPEASSLTLPDTSCALTDANDLRSCVVGGHDY
ncbi:hypothetical protein PR202_gb17586 [Eleusine coracana subsp. coracana]|uniref:Uncharacterized protein n=1 Tax=Eleusine coracana subsp. coracana TaxID=191504 RepID=A0AAV5F3Z6_ELECO|nr:hypothetical protein PR202_gb17586 [Eleusine coracana subsp. coracana]